MAEIKEDSLVRYKGTGTIGRVKVLRVEDDGVAWAFLDSTGLYYRLDTLEIIEKAQERRELEGMTIEQIQERFRQTQDMMEAVRMQDESLESGG
ncbi:MAG TPA: DUF2098 domain-containing protein [Methanothrix sp.]|jgi:hypothetical protein|nr:DUF2098 domain-containing protein [Methanothrix sp.]HOV82530.1 DUF2098 domain-containing protein [Methanothrix sp.]HPC89265.1 DUF2098 domain-containing protein [Methanothrix sp.]HQE86716.1 DUF2098 domain-containing protein [Methanothrix sp.]HQI67245.1 DUF2098 domain-containing protein [Methanothrix sp.]